MFYDVRVYDSRNHIKKIIRKEELSKRHWIKFFQEQTKNVLPQKGKEKLKILKPMEA